jgi:hypothetical protein
MSVDRRGFLKAGASALLASKVGGAAAVGRDAGASTHATLAGAMASAGFDPTRGDAFVAAFASDVHYGAGDPAMILAPILAELRRMDPLPAFFGIAGDLINKASRSFGDIPGEPQRREALAEFRLLKGALAGLDDRIPLKLALGNHDTYPGEGAPRLFHSVFPDHPEYHSFAVKGVGFVFLNGGSNGGPDAAQRGWFRRQVRALDRPGATLVTVLHQPSLGSMVKERGVTLAIREGLEDARGDLWTIGGHEHRNATDGFRLPHGAVVTQSTITRANPAVWGEEPGYWLWCFAGGRLVARIFRRVGRDFTVAGPLPLDRVRPLELPFEGRDSQVLFRAMVGEGDTPYLIDHDAGWCLNYWHYVKRLTYRFPLKLGGPEARRLCILETHEEKPQFRCLVGPDPSRLVPVDLAERDGSYSFIELPGACRDAGIITVRLEGCVVSGFALTT